MSGPVRMWTRIPPTFLFKRNDDIATSAFKTSLAAVGYACGWLHHQTWPTNSSQLNSTANSSARLLCCECVLHSPSNCQSDFVLPERTWTTQVNSITEKTNNKCWNKNEKYSIELSNQQSELVVLVQRLSAHSTLCGPCSQPGPRLWLGYVGLRLDPPGLTDFWGAGVVPMW